MTERMECDLLDGRFYAGDFGDPRAAYGWMREHEPVYRDSNGMAAIATYDALLQAEKHPEVFSNAGGIRPETGPLPQMIDMDDPEHKLRRLLVSGGFTRGRVEAKMQSIRAICDALIDGVCERGECDFVADLAAPLPMAVIGDMLGVRPQDRSTFLQWSDDLMCALGSNVTAEMLAASARAYLAFSEFTKGVIDERRAQPTDDLTSILVNAEIDGARLTDDDIVGETLLILIGGDETTRHVLSGGMERLIANPEQRERIRADPSKIPAAVEEMIRWVSPIKNMCRTLTRDIDYHGTELRRNEKVLLLFESANFDAKVFTDPETFDAARSPNNHLAFGFGAHFCLGNQLARLEGRIMFEQLLSRLPDIELATDGPLRRRAANFVTGFESTPVRFTPTPARAD